MAVVLVDVNWGRSWGCAGYENAQLVNLTFDHVSPAEKYADDEYSEIKLKTPSRLFVNPDYSNYGFIVRPGVYALTEFTIKVARSVSDVGYIKAGKSELIEGRKYHGGILRVGAGEVVYVGHFDLDCMESPIPWRYYLEGQDAFDEYVADVRKKFRFLKDADFVYRLFFTTNFGVDRYIESGVEHESAGDYVSARDSFEQALEFAKSSGAPVSYVSAALYNLGRMYGYTCDLAAAERYLVEALDAERALDEPDGGNITKRLSELARLSFDMGKYRRSADFYAEAVGYLDQTAIANEDPIGYADYLSAYAVVSDETGAADTARDMRKRAAGLHSENEGRTADFVPVEYRDVCGDQIAR